MLGDAGTPEIYRALSELMYPKILGMIQEMKAS
jgi:hypothetical protein